MFMMFAHHFNMIISKIIFFKNIILIYFETKNTLKSNRYHTSKHALSNIPELVCELIKLIFLDDFKSIFLYL
jgi:hypothetical protein